MDSESGGGGATLYIVVFFLCVISMLSGYFYYAMGSSEAEAQKKVAEIQAKADREMADAKSAAEKDKIANEAAMQAAKAKLQAESTANASKIKLQNKALAKSKAKLQSDLAAASKAIKQANALKLTANKAKADADKKAAEATRAIQKAQKSGKENEKKLADEKKKLATQAQNKVNEANKKAAQAIEAAKKDAQAVIELKQRLDSAETKLKQGAVASAMVKGQAVRIVQAVGTAQKPKGSVQVHLNAVKFEGKRATKGKIYEVVELGCGPMGCLRGRSTLPLEIVRFDGRDPRHVLIRDKYGKFCTWGNSNGGKAGDYFNCMHKNIALKDAYDKKAVFTGKRLPKDYATPRGVKFDEEVRNQLGHLAGVKQDGGLSYCKIYGTGTKSRYALRCNDYPNKGVFRLIRTK